MLAIVMCAMSLLSFAAEAPKIVTWKTPNQVEVWYVYRPQLPILDVRMVFNAGSVYDGDSPGLASLTASSLSAGTQHMDEQALNLAMSKTGAKFSVDVTHDYSMVFLRTLTQAPYQEQAIQILRDLITHPSFDEAVVKRFQQQAIVGLHLMENDADYVASQRFTAALYQGTPYAQLTEGTPTSIASINRQQLQTFFAQHYVADQTVLVLVGDINKDQAKHIADELTASLPALKQKAFPFSQQDLPTPKPDHIRQYLRGAQTTILMGQRGIAVKNPDYYPLMVGNTILGGGIIQSRLFKTVRTKYGLTYGITSDLSLSKQPAPFSIEAKTKNDSTDKAIALIKSEVDAYMNEGPTQAELKLAKQALIGSFPLRWSSNSDLANRLAWMAYYNYPTTYWTEYPERVQAVTIDDIKQAFQHWLQPKDWTVVTVGGAG